ncbi:NADH-dependent flavin oxidoreductase [Lachnellula subtilissima]|uniref:NADH-dependent flavin oxidoreductase n=1 Tax=Lachnellula subtilissima TaxID=602034 RepID=A0A8H8RQ12_9HELO|nr:NADH-dependent flavin oxidoreductase [Lachnellula subtilissima]
MLASQEITLPSGLVLPNRLAKAAMAEAMAPASHVPDEKFHIAYGEWAKGGWGIILTGNVQVSEFYLGQPGDIQTPASPSDATKQLWKEWADATQRFGTPALVQLCHPGRQSPSGAGNRSWFSKNVAPSAVQLNLGPGFLAKAAAALKFGTPREMTDEDIALAIDQFVAGAKQTHEAGFKGVELHAAHGYLLSQFLSPTMNFRTDEFGGSPRKRAEIVLRIIRRIRAETSTSFTIGIKLNSVDASAFSSLDEVIEQISLIKDAGIDFMEISGGSYEDPDMMKEPDQAPPVKKSTLQREAFFLTFAQTVRSHFPTLILMVTGGFRTRIGMEAALQSGACDIIGIGRPAAVLPLLPKEIILNEEIGDEDASVKLKPLVLPGWVNWVSVTAVGAGLQSDYYGGQIQRIAMGLKPVDTRA